MLTQPLTFPSSTASDATAWRPGRPSFTRLTAVELRKMVNTTSGRWLLVTFLALPLVVLAFSLRGAVTGISITDNAWDTPLTVLRQFLPVLGILAMTSEWTQRTTLTTFALVPQRGRVLAAKLVAALVLTVAVVVTVAALCAGFSVLTGLLTSTPVHADHALQRLGGEVITAALQTLLGAALGAVIQQTAVTMVIYFLVPTLVEVGASTAFGRGSRWVSVLEGFDNIATMHLTGVFAPTLVVVVLWVLLPLGIGTVRTLTRHVD
ncbi:MAG: hypothetical protein ACRYF3_04600 [Janthinobacterium lividum]